MDLSDNNSTYNFMLIRQVTEDISKIQPADFQEDTSKNIYFFLKNSSLGAIDSDQSVIDLSIVEFLNRRNPINFVEVETDIRANADFSNTNLFSYEELINEFESVRDQYTPPNTKKKSDFDLWSSFKMVDFNDSDQLLITTSMLKHEIYDVLRDISHVGWKIKPNGISRTIDVSENSVPSNYYDIPKVRFIDLSTIEVTVKPFQTLTEEKQYKRNIFFTIPEGHYGTLTTLKNQLNKMSPKYFYDNYLAGNSAGAEDLISRVINTPVDLSNIGYKTHQLIRDSYNNDYGTSSLNLIDWNFTINTDSDTKKFDFTISPDVKFIFFNKTMEDIFDGSIGCGTSRNKAFFNKRSTLGRMMGYYSDGNTDESFELDSTTNNLSRQMPDLRRVRQVQIMLIDYKSYASAANANQNLPAPPIKSLKTPLPLIKSVS